MAEPKVTDKDKLLYQLKTGYNPKRKDGTFANLETDREAKAAEKWFVEKILGLPFQPNDRLPEFTWKGWTGDVKWLGAVSWEPLIPRYGGHLIVNQECKPRDLYVSVAGSISAGFSFVGWAWRREVTQELKSFGHNPEYALHIKWLRPLDEFKNLTPKGEEPETGATKNLSTPGIHPVFNLKQEHLF